MKQLTFLTMLVAAMLLFSSCGLMSHKTEETGAENDAQTTFSGKTSPQVPEENGPKKEPVSKAEQLLKRMTLEEKVGQLFVVRPEALQAELTPKQVNDSSQYGAKELSDEMKGALTRYPVGGVVMFGKNVETPQQLKPFISSLQQESKVPLLVGVDEEGGGVSRIANNPNFNVPKFNDMREIGISGKPVDAKQVGLQIGTYLKEFGFNLDFAPVCDVNTNPENIVIGKRAFGSDPNLVAQMVAAEISGLQEAGIMNCAKHFPGHGDTKGDTHKGFVSVEKTWNELKQCELVPFQQAISSGTDMIMISHITTPNISLDNLPASLSYQIVENKVRKELHYNGVIITDSMSMGAITQTYSAGESAVMAISAGVDIVLMPEDLKEAYESVLQAVKKGTLSEDRINESVLRILSLKEKYSLL